MSIYSGHVSVSGNDWTYDFIGLTTVHSGTTILAQRTRDGGGALTVDNTAYADLDTSGIDTGWTINTAILRWYTHAYTTTPKEDPESSSIEIYTTGATWSQIDSVSANRSVGWESHALTANELNHIRITGNTSFKFNMGNVTTFNSIRSWTIRSYEYAGDNTYSVWLDVDYTAPSVGIGNNRKRVIIIS